MLATVMYHYVREPGGRFGRMNYMRRDDFVAQIDALSAEFEMATLETALAYMNGEYYPSRDLCLLTFDDGVKDHFDVAEILAERGLQGVFFVVTSALERRRLLDVHKNHFLMASLDFPEYQDAVLSAIAEPAAVDIRDVRRIYRWDTEEVARFKYLLNFQVAPEYKSRLLTDLINERVGDEAELSCELYLSWAEARKMQGMGMVIGGHTESHLPLGGHDAEWQFRELVESKRAIVDNCRQQELWPFAYPNGSHDATTISLLQAAGYCCAFVAGCGVCQPGASPWSLVRLDPKDVCRLGLLPQEVEATP